MAKFEQHKFYCPKCGKSTIPLPRKLGHKHKNYHRKKLYCPWCKQVVNCIEIQNEEQEEYFLINFKAGMFQEEE